MHRLVLGLLLLVVAQARAQPAGPKKPPEPFDITEAIMLSTVRIEGTGSAGTGFLILDPGSFPILITAASVIEAVKEPQVKLAMRRRTKDGWELVSIKMPITEFAKPSHADIAALPVQLPPEVLPSSMLSSDVLADDDLMQQQGVRTGTEAFVVSYPFGLLATEEGFGMLKSGRVASFPIYPTRQRQVFILDRDLVDGEYGAPVFVRTETFASEDGTMRRHPQGGFVIGIVGKPWEATSRMRLVTVIPSSLVKDTVEMVKKGIEHAAPQPRQSSIAPASAVAVAR